MSEKELSYEELEKISGGRLEFDYKFVTLHIKYSYCENGITITKTDDVIIDYKSGRTSADDVDFAKDYCQKKGYKYISVTHSF